MEKSLDTIFTSDVMTSLNRPPVSKQLRWRLAILQADLKKDEYNRASRNAWNNYVAVASMHGFFSQSENCDLRKRLTDREDNNFRGAMAECMAAWFFLETLGWKITPRPRGQGRRELELTAMSPEGPIMVEVKAPFREQFGTMGSGNDSDLIEKTLQRANNQFASGNKNLLFLAPKLRSSLGQDRYQIIQALIGQTTIDISIKNPEVEEDPNLIKFEEPRVEFQLDGMFTRLIKKDCSPGFTRVSAVLSVEEIFRYHDDTPYIDHTMLLVHNPYASTPLSPNTFSNVVQFQAFPDGWRWADGQDASA